MRPPGRVRSVAGAPCGTSRRRGTTQADQRRPAPAINDLWYKNAVIYCLAVGTFMDGNGDGIGDFQGLMRRLDYLPGSASPPSG